MDKTTPQINQPLTSSQKKIAEISAPTAVETAQNTNIPDQIADEIEELIEARKEESHWLVPIIVVLVVGATIYLAIDNNKVEYVYSLASAAFAFYFGQLVPSYNSNKKSRL